MLSSWRNVKLLGKNVRAFSELVQVVEAGPRDGLQNVKEIVPTAKKIELINKLSETGLRSIKVPRFDSPKWLPRITDGLAVYEGIAKNPKVEYSVHVSSLEGMRKAAELRVAEVEFAVGASETFNRKNFNVPIEESLRVYREARKLREYRETKNFRTEEKKIRLRGAISCVLGCPYEGEVEPKAVAKIVEDLFDIGCYEILLADTVGAGTPAKFVLLLNELKAVTGGDVWRFAVDFRDTYGQALANVYECLNQGIRVFDSSIAGLGGCPLNPGVTGSVPTEDLVYLLHGQGMETGVDLDKLIEIGDFVTRSIPNVRNNSKVGKASLARKKKPEDATEL